MNLTKLIKYFLLFLFFFTQTDRLINVEDDFSDYDSSASNSNEVDVKEALRSTISSNLLKNKYQKGMVIISVCMHV